ncbi:MAG: type IV pilin protein [Pseudomonadota bacterium]
MKCCKGFTLIDLLIAMTIVAILAAIALPTYQRQVVRGKRAQSQAALMELMQQQERFYTHHNTYLAFSADSPPAAEPRLKWWSGASETESAYEIRGAACPGRTIIDCVQLEALPGTDKVDRHFHDPECGILTLSSVGATSASGAGSRCWP